MALNRQKVARLQTGGILKYLLFLISRGTRGLVTGELRYVKKYVAETERMTFLIATTE